MIDSGKVMSINVREKKGKYCKKKSINITSAEGIVEENRENQSIDQISIIGIETIRKIRKMKIKGFCTVKFVANLNTQGVLLFELKKGTRLKIGSTIQQITKIGKKCYSDCPIAKAGIYCPIRSEVIFTKVLYNGKIQINNKIKILD